MTDLRPVLIGLRLGLGIVLLVACVYCSAMFCTTKNEVLMTASAVAAMTTFCIGIYFYWTALDLKLWEPLKPDFREWEEDPHKTSVE